MATNFEADWQDLCSKIAGILAMPVKAQRKPNAGIIDKAKAAIAAEDESASVEMVKGAILKARELDKQVDEGIRSLLGKKKELVKIHKQLEAWSQGKEPAPEKEEAGNDN